MRFRYVTTPAGPTGHMPVLPATCRSYRPHAGPTGPMPPLLAQCRRIPASGPMPAATLPHHVPLPAIALHQQHLQGPISPRPTLPYPLDEIIDPAGSQRPCRARSLFCRTRSLARTHASLQSRPRKANGNTRARARDGGRCPLAKLRGVGLLYGSEICAGFAIRSPLIIIGLQLMYYVTVPSRPSRLVGFILNTGGQIVSAPSHLQQLNCFLFGLLFVFGPQLDSVLPPTDTLLNNWR